MAEALPHDAPLRLGQARHRAFALRWRGQAQRRKATNGSK
ncbi:hypothetical protein OH686_17945 [Pseudomonas sp. SO81]|nr:hypothetical protein OH686_17945 [Pseudomonas sp. SO81]